MNTGFFIFFVCKLFFLILLTFGLNVLLLYFLWFTIKVSPFKNNEEIKCTFV